MVGRSGAKLGFGCVDRWSLTVDPGGTVVERPITPMSGTRTTIVRCANCGIKNRVPDRASGVPKCGKCGSALPWITEGGDDDFEEVVESASVPVLVDLWAEWCGPCRMVSPALEQLATQMAGRLKLVKVNVDTSPALTRRFEVQGIPTLLLLEGGKVVSRRTGAAPLDEIQRWMEKALPSHTH
jgi:thioredoxin 2